MEYMPNPTARAFHECDDHFKAIVGPIACGKTTACIMDMLGRCREQHKVDGVRKSRWAICCATHESVVALGGELKEWTEVLTFHMLDKTRPILARLVVDDIEVDFYIFDMSRDDEQQKHAIQAMEFTGVWLRDADSLERESIASMFCRYGRYPSKRAGGCKWYGVIMDYTPPLPLEHWIRNDRPHTVFRFPNAAKEVEGRLVVNEDAENRKNLVAGYYEQIINDMPELAVRSYLMGQ